MLEKDLCSEATPHAAWPNLGGSATSAQLSCLLKNVKVCALCRRKVCQFFLQMTDQRFLGTNTLNIEFYADLIIAINSFDDF